MWKRQSRWDEHVDELYNLVIPKADQAREQQLLDHWSGYQLWTVHAGASSDSLVAMATVLWMPETKTAYINCFTLHPSIRGRGYARPYWQALREEWSREFVGVRRIAIQAYLHNVPFFERIFGWTQMPRLNDVEFMRQCYCPTPVKWLTGRITGDATANDEQMEIYREFVKKIKEVGKFFYCY